MQLTDKEKNDVIAMGFFMVLVIGGLAYFWFMFGKGMIEKKQIQTDTKYQELEVTWTKMDQLDIFIDETKDDKYDKLVAKIAEVNKLLPTSSQPITFFAALDGALRETNIQPTEARPEVLGGGTEYEEIPYSIIANGGYANFRTFLSKVEQNPDRFMRIKTFKIVNSLDRPEMHTVDTKIATYRFKELAEQQATTVKPGVVQPTAPVVSSSAATQAIPSSRPSSKSSVPGARPAPSSAKKK
ncbi:MAG TPA: type 4a pilus biogenesis protein PilO [Candidatus Sumerlaeota bacterium]|nr:type 4a pilus biogenesis protein PilO [Candidatus Sumerlaeota bacterium]HPS02188.1 type 4a pilus biogenesis protein PilO [Candidatus Sumerlaeota bacterium]